MNTKVIDALGISREEFSRQVKEARKRGEQALKHNPRAISARYENGYVTVDLLSGWSFSFDPRKYKALKNASDKELTDVKPLGFGFTLEWKSIDQHLGVGPLIIDLIGEKYLAIELSRRIGSATSEKKRASSRANGKLGGRPKKATRG